MTTATHAQLYRATKRGIVAGFIVRDLGDGVLIVTATAPILKWLKYNTYTSQQALVDHVHQAGYAVTLTEEFVYD